MSGMTPAVSRLWLRRPRPHPSPRLRLVCFPHAGGTPSLCRGWQDRLPSDVELSAVCYPGRQNRISEPPIDRMEHLADRICEVLSALTDRPIALFGHSMGAVVAYEVAVRLTERHGTAPVALMVSAHGAPQLCRGGPRQAPLSDDALAEHAIAADPRLVCSQELMELVMPVLRADHDLLHAYRPARTPRLTAPITGYVGADDPSVPHDDMRAWRHVAGSGFETRVFPGDHFYLTGDENEAALLADMGDRLSGVGSSVHAGALGPFRERTQ